MTVTPTSLEPTSTFAFKRVLGSSAATEAPDDVIPAVTRGGGALEAVVPDEAAPAGGAATGVPAVFTVAPAEAKDCIAVGVVTRAEDVVPVTGESPPVATAESEDCVAGFEVGSSGYDADSWDRESRGGEDTALDAAGGIGVMGDAEPSPSELARITVAAVARAAVEPVGGLELAAAEETACQPHSMTRRSPSARREPTTLAS